MTRESPMTDKSQKLPLTYTISKWYGFLFAGTYVLYGGVSIVLDIMDRSFDNTLRSVIFLVLGIILTTVAFAYRDRKAWGWYGMMSVVVLSMLLLLPNIGALTSIIMFAISAVALGLLVVPATKNLIFKRS